MQQLNQQFHETAGLIAALEVITKVTIYYFHERIWNSLSWGMES